MRKIHSAVIAGLVPAIHGSTSKQHNFEKQTAARWIAGTSPAMTILKGKYEVKRKTVPFSPSSRRRGGVRHSREGVSGIVLDIKPPSHLWVLPIASR